MFARLSAIAAGLVLACTTITSAQEPEQLVAAQPAPPPLPWDASSSPRDSWTIEDGDLLAVLDNMVGSYRSRPTGSTPELMIHIAPVAIEGLSNALYYELHRADDAANPFRSGIIHAYERRAEPRLRYFEMGDGTAAALKGIWAVPYAFPKLVASDLTPIADLVIDSMSGSAFSAATPMPYPSMRDGASEFTSSLALNGNTLVIADRGYDPDGNKVWGDDQDLEFRRTRADVTVNTTDAGLIMIDLVVPDDADTLEAGGEVAVHYAGYLADGTRFDTSRQEGRQPFRTTIPGRVIQGWNDGVVGMKVGQRRRLIIPPALGYGDRGAGGLIPPGATLMFDVECLWVRNPEAQPEQADGEAAELVP